MDLQLIISRLPLNFLPRKGGGDGFVSGTDSLPIMNEGMEMIILSAPPLSTVLQAETNAGFSTEPMVHPTSANRGDDRT
jgi:hypothetical protein